VVDQHHCIVWQVDRRAVRQAVEGNRSAARGKHLLTGGGSDDRVAGDHHDCPPAERERAHGGVLDRESRLEPEARAAVRRAVQTSGPGMGGGEAADDGQAQA